MTDQYPPNPFHRSPEESGTRESKLFATGASSPYSPNESLSQTPSNPRSSNKISSRRELRIKQSEIKRNVLIVVSILIGLLMALIATDTWKLGTGPKPSFSSSIQSSLSQKSETANVAGERAEIIRELSSSDPLRVYIGGDSLVGSYGNSLAKSLGSTGVVKAAYDSRVSSGLVNKEFFNWNSHIKRINATYNPELIVFQIGTNDAGIVTSNPNGYKSKYRDLLNEFLKSVDSDNKEVVFVLAPAMKDSKLNRNVKLLNNVIKEFAQDKSKIVFDSGSILSPNGKFITSILIEKKITIRSDDGIHITGGGGMLLADSMYNFLNNRFGISRFKEGKAILPLKVPGCCKSPTTTPNTVSPQEDSSNSVSKNPSTSSSTTSPDSEETIDTTPDFEEELPLETATNSE